MTFIPYGRQDITDEDVKAVCEVLRSDFLTQGPAIEKFEKTVAEYCGASHAVAMNSATSALHVACLALDLGPGDWLWTSPNTFVASANCALYCGAQVDFVDIDPDTHNMSIEVLERKLQAAESEGRLPKIVIPVHFAGEPCDLKAIKALAERYRFKIIDDASHAIGGRYGEFVIGGTPYSDITIFSFHPVKIVTTGEGGMAVTNNPELGVKLARLRTHGITRNPAEMTREPDGPWYYEQIGLGYNYRITDIQAALGVSQMGRLDAYINRRHELAARYDELLAPLPLKRPFRNPENLSGLHLYVIVLNDAGRRKQVFDTLRANGIGVNVHYIPVHLQPYYQTLGFKLGDFPAAEAYYSGAISLPMFATLTDEQQDRVVNVLSDALA
ncbi:MAG: UDP-4-amino-4,6-dideoxy-N-acetyl-beta-L-altrosamine transaminase [Zoogloea sp.]|uniref:UDP-4-amino-4, 6-dideoxy-N-acetyl-beta-L-altrosamine transaminase n=1 Tax=Zoogloea sp. TaxID=49181 RepID=UPI002604DAE8|nr:UDP-4-amino-4,6-dideoxy-N-acetyl-beta-L-altrosamine transaminase [Zoogloea sp.]MDD3326648.1 UDP-4-amino-4,6-dideoxy-N-acetyl-beta-L-altrosamine transaminase [Zoogloea sp.]